MKLPPDVQLMVGCIVLFVVVPCGAIVAASLVGNWLKTRRKQDTTPVLERNEFGVVGKQTWWVEET